MATTLPHRSSFCNLFSFLYRLTTLFRASLIHVESHCSNPTIPMQPFCLNCNWCHKTSNSDMPLVSTLAVVEPLTLLPAFTVYNTLVNRPPDTHRTAFTLNTDQNHQLCWPRGSSLRWRFLPVSASTASSHCSGFDLLLSMGTTCSQAERTVELLCPNLPAEAEVKSFRHRRTDQQLLSRRHVVVFLTGALPQRGEQGLSQRDGSAG
ncbi:hypothetical protein CRENBAI_005886 [Crenichthys baileyi]|uniref:Uncharacterized protein n=1 Tax=Crenichthys baileyi TaxID=28760 RepID=A0AAV9RNC1_9TELE